MDAAHVNIGRRNFIEKRKAASAKPPGSYEELNSIQKAVLDLACFEGSILISGARMMAYRSAAQLLVKKGVLSREDGGNFYRPTQFGISLYDSRKKTPI